MKQLHVSIDRKWGRRDKNHTHIISMCTSAAWQWLTLVLGTLRCDSHKLLWLQSKATLAEILVSVQHCAKSLWNTKALWRSARPPLWKADLLNLRFSVHIWPIDWACSHRRSACWGTHTEKPQMPFFFSARTTGPRAAELQLSPRWCAVLKSHAHTHILNTSFRLSKNFKALPAKDEPSRVLDESVSPQTGDSRKTFTRQVINSFLVRTLESYEKIKQAKHHLDQALQIFVTSYLWVCKQASWCLSNCSLWLLNCLHACQSKVLFFLCANCAQKHSSVEIRTCLLMSQRAAIGGWDIPLSVWGYQDASFDRRQTSVCFLTHWGASWIINGVTAQGWKIKSWNWVSKWSLQIRLWE